MGAWRYGRRAPHPTVVDPDRVGTRIECTDDVGLVVITDHQTLLGPDTENVEHVQEHLPVGFAAPELSLHLDVVEVTAKFEALDLRALGGRGSVGDEGQKLESLPQARQRRNSAVEETLRSDAVRDETRGSLARRDRVGSTERREGRRNDLAAGRIQIEATAPMAIGIGPEPVRLHHHFSVEFTSVEIGMNGERVCDGDIPSLVSTRPVVEDRVIEIEEDGAQ